MPVQLAASRHLRRQQTQTSADMFWSRCLPVCRKSYLQVCACPGDTDNSLCTTWYDANLKKTVGSLSNT